MTITSLAILVAVISVATTMTMVQANSIVEECSGNDEICKTIDIIHDDLNFNGYIEPHEPVWYDTEIVAQNPTANLWTDVKVQDNLGGDLEIGGSNQPENDLTNSDNLDCSDSKTKGKTKKVQLRCDVDDGFGDHDLDPNGAETATLGFLAHTDVNPGQGKPKPFGQGKLEYTSCGIHFANSGATVSGIDLSLAFPFTFAFSTEGISVQVFTPNKAGDCDGDGISDADEESGAANSFGGAPTDPFNPDSDGDGLLDGEETSGSENNNFGNAPTDPNNANTDGDGCSDFVETSGITDPNTVDCP